MSWYAIPVGVIVGLILVVPKCRKIKNLDDLAKFADYVNAIVNFALFVIVLAVSFPLPGRIKDFTH